MTVVVEVENQKVEKEVAIVVQKATQMSVSTPEEQKFATEFLQEIKKAEKLVGEHCDPTVDAAFKAHREATAMRAKFLDPLKKATAIVKQKLVDFKKVEEARVERAAAAGKVAPVAEKAEGLSYRDTYRVEVTDMVALCKAIAAGKVGPGVVTPNIKALTDMAKSGLKMPGVKVTVDSSAVVRGKG